MMSANSAVPSGAPVHDTGSAWSSPSHVCCLGISPVSLNALLVSWNVMSDDLRYLSVPGLPACEYDATRGQGRKFPHGPASLRDGEIPAFWRPLPSPS